MAAGLEISNDTGRVQITSEYANMILRSKKRKINRNNFTTDGLFFAIQPDIGEDIGFGQIEDWGFSAENQKRANLCTPYGDAGSSLGDMTIYSFDIPTAADLTTTDKLGLEVYKADGTVAYNSNLKYMKVLASSKNYVGTDVLTRDEMGGIFNYYGKRTTLNFGHANVAVIFNMAYHVNQVDMSAPYSLVSTCRIRPNFDLTISDFDVLAYGDVTGAISTECSWLVIDTTNL
ncbi:hypothetical protein [Psychrobacter sp. UBA6291]|uniref:hypothetical protein n=1 Tax=Psychrobacter sp. UBA6291 TaxID=1947357 RepID=UPI00257AEC7B|nr:hypothetical protein [Psychrobacter sp. UBA6291]